MPPPLPPHTRIVEGVMTTVSDVDRYRDDPSLVNIAPMGPIVDDDWTNLTLRPFTSSTTYRNLKSTGQGVFHLTDNALLIARGAIGRLNARLRLGGTGVSPVFPSRTGVSPVMTNTDGPDNHLTKNPETPPDTDVPLHPAQHIQGVVLINACRYFEFRVTSLDDSQDRTRIEAEVVHVETLRDWSGFNRAKHAVIEAAILATRIHLTGPESILAEYKKLQTIVDKTGSQDEHTAMQELTAFIKSHQQESPSLPGRG